MMIRIKEIEISLKWWLVLLIVMVVITIIMLFIWLMMSFRLGDFIEMIGL